MQQGSNYTLQKSFLDTSITTWINRAHAPLTNKQMERAIFRKPLLLLLIVWQLTSGCCRACCWLILWKRKPPTAQQVLKAAYGDKLVSLQNGTQKEWQKSTDYASWICWFPGISGNGRVQWWRWWSLCQAWQTWQWGSWKTSDKKTEKSMIFKWLFSYHWLKLGFFFCRKDKMETWGQNSEKATTNTKGVVVPSVGLFSSLKH